jgi:hypothetical protein
MGYVGDVAPRMDVIVTADLNMLTDPDEQPS